MKVVYGYGKLHCTGVLKINTSTSIIDLQVVCQCHCCNDGGKNKRS